MHGVQNEVVPLCVMDFYVHHTKQHHGCGKKLFEHMLKVVMWVVYRHTVVTVCGFYFHNWGLILAALYVCVQFSS